MTAHGRDVVFNVVWTGTAFDHLRFFVASQLDACDARYRFIANACPPEQIEAMEAFADQHPGRVVEVVEVARDRMIRHGEALDAVLATRDDGPWFALIDPDILARGRFLEPFLDALTTCEAVTSGKEVWSEHNVRPAGHPGVNGEYFFDDDGFVFGSPHFAVYRREPLLRTLDRWGVGFANAGNDLPDPARQRLAAVDRDYWMYDTGKVANILFQADGNVLRHLESPDLLHVGGVSHFLAPPSTAPAARLEPPRWGEGSDWGEQAGMAGRYAVASYTASVIAELTSGRPAPPLPDLPDSVDASLRERLALVRFALIELMAAHGPLADRAAREGARR